MRAAVYYTNSDVRLEQVPEPVIGRGEIKVRVVASGICGSDVMEWYRVKTAPRVLGHEIAGEICEIGADVSSYKTGQRVFVSHHVPCNTCRYCLKGCHTACDTLHSTNYDPGGFAEYIRVPQINVDRGVYLLPDELSYDVGSFVEPLACVVRAYRLAAVMPGDRVLILGAGIAGLLFVKLAKALGAGEITASDINRHRLEVARRFGADRVVDAREDEIEQGTVDRVFICTGVSQVVPVALEAVDRGGRVLFFAVDKPGVDVPVPINSLWRNEIMLQTSYGAAPADLAVSMELLRSGRVKIDDMITHKFGLAEAGEGFKLVADAGESLKVIIEPQR